MQSRGCVRPARVRGCVCAELLSGVVRTPVEVFPAEIHVL